MLVAHRGTSLIQGQYLLSQSGPTTKPNVCLSGNSDCTCPTNPGPSRFFSVPRKGQLAWSLIFLDMISFIIHPSTAPLISSLSDTHSSLFFFFFPLLSHISLIFHKSAMSPLLSLSHFVCLWYLAALQCRLPLIYSHSRCICATKLM